MKNIIFDCDGTLIDSSGPKLSLFPGIRELLEELSKHCLLYVWTGGGRASTLRALEEMGIRSYFDGISTVDDHPSKPSPAGPMSLVGSAPKNSVCIIGDSSADMLGAKNFGVLAIGALWNKRASPSILKDSGADFLVSHPEECSKLIELNLKAET